MKQHNIPWLGAFMEAFFVTLPLLGIINFWAIITVLYTNIRPYLLLHMPWVTLWLFVVALTVIGIVGMFLVYKFVLPSVWSFRGKQMLGQDTIPAKRHGVVVAVSGGFDPLNGRGHITHIQEARKLGDWLVVIVSRDDQLAAKNNKPNGTFYPSIGERICVIMALRDVDEVVVNIDRDGTCTETLRTVQPNIFAKGGDRVPDSMPQSELDVCKDIGCKIVYGVGEPKVTSSSALARKAVEISR
jgi:cytidyltransferase-like protein